MPMPLELEHRGHAVVIQVSRPVAKSAVDAVAHRALDGSEFKGRRQSIRPVFIGEGQSACAESKLCR
jgi:hypothetical protein